MLLSFFLLFIISSPACSRITSVEDRMIRYVFPALLLFAPMICAEETPSFLNEVLPLLTKSGCNQGSCHGKGAGQNGFKLSLRGYAPDQDYHWLVREFSARRVQPARAEASLILTKATGLVPHEGGKLFGTSSKEYDTLKRWILAGSPGPNAADPKLTKLSVKVDQSRDRQGATNGKMLLGSRGSDRALKVGETIPMQATAEFSDGTRKDVTWLTVFETNDAAILSVSKTGEVKALRSGASAIRAAYLTEVAVATFSVPFDIPINDAKFPAGKGIIDSHIIAKLKELRIEPSPLCDDATFLRRAMLDTLGVLPSAEEVRKFEADQSPGKRAKLIDQMLQRPEFTDYWTLFLSDLLQNRKERDHDVRGVKGVRQFYGWIRQQMAANKGWDTIAREVLLSTGKTTDNPAVGYYLVTVGEHRETEKSEVAESVAHAFLGSRIGCARCHNHPLEKYTQDDFFHFAAFFSRIRLERKDPKAEASTLVVGVKDAKENDKPVQVRQPRTNKMMKPQALDRSAPAIKPGEDPRLSLVEWIVSPKNESFRGAMVNRIWKHFFREGLVEPVDDLRETNPPSNPALFAALGEEFAKNKFDFKHLMRMILNSETYQRDSATTPGNATDTRFYSHYYARRLPAEVLLDAISSATDVAENFDGYPLGIRAVQVPNPVSASPFLKMFGSSERVTACACERSGDVTLPQILKIINADLLNTKLNDGNGALAKLLKSEMDNAKVAEELFLIFLGRKPSAKQLKLVMDIPADQREEFFRDMAWALVNSKEFVFNH